MKSYGMKNSRLHAKGFTLIASLLMLLLLSGIAIGLMMMVNTEGKVGSTDLQNNVAFHAADGGIEKMASDLSATFTNAQAPSAAQICALGGSNYQPVMAGVTWTQYTVTPASGCTGTLTATWGQITAGPNQGLWAQIIPINMLTTADLVGGQEVSMTRSAQAALIPVFQFAVFSESDLSFFSGPNFDVAGPVHTNGDLYPFVGPGSTLTFHNKIRAYGNVVRTQLANGWNAATNYNGTVDVPTTGNGCSTATTNCVAMTSPSSASYGDGSVVGAGSATAQTGANYNTTYWNPFSQSSTNYMLINGNYGSTTTPGTGAKKLSMPFVAPGAKPFQIIRRALSSDSTALSQSREYNLAQIRVLLSDDPADLPGGASDANNVRLANVTANSSGTGASNPYGIATSVGTTTGTATLPAAASGSSYTTYFATATNAIPTGSCNGAYNSGSTPTISISCLPDWPYPPAPWTPTNMTNVGAGTDPSGCILLCPSSQTSPWSPSNTSGTVSAPFISYEVNNAVGTMAGSSTLYTTGSNLGTYAGNSPNNLATTSMPTFLPCPPTYALATNTPPPCPQSSVATPSSPFYLVDGSSTFTAPATTAQSPAVATATWNLIDGWLRVEYKDASGNWHPVTNEWLQLGFARDVTPPTANEAGLPAGGTANPINPNAILLLQEPADRYTQVLGAYPTSAITSTAHPNGFSTAATAACNSTSGSGATKTCTSWTVAPPQVLQDSTASNSWLFGLTSSTSPSTPQTSTLALQSPTRFNWYPINFYDAREGEVRDNTVADNSCTTNGLMNAVEIDVGNLKQWLLGNIGTSGTSVDYVAQNGYVLYFSDRRGMLPNPNYSSTAFFKSGDAGLEDVINGSAANGTPNGALEPIPAGRNLSPEDVNQNGLLDNYGAENLGLGFYGTVGNPVTEPVTTTCSNATMPCVLAATANPNPGKNLWYQINNAAPPDPFGTAANARINSCRSARKNWVSGARHVLRLVDGSLGNVPLTPTGTAADPGGFTVASENPVYILAPYNTNSADTTWNATPADESGHASAAVIADAVTLLSSSWNDMASVGLGGDGTVTNTGNRNASTDYYRTAIAGGKNINFPQPTWTGVAQDFGTDGGVHNFLRYLENWGGQTLNYKGSIVSLYYSTYGTGIYKCCSVVYSPPTRNYIFDADFTNPAGLPPGTPMFRDVESLSYRQLFATRQTGQ